MNYVKYYLEHYSWFSGGPVRNPLLTFPYSVKRNYNIKFNGMTYSYCLGVHIILLNKTFLL